MDAAEADADVKLYKASAELLIELQAKVPRLVVGPDGHFRKWILRSKQDEVVRLLDRFQEWPQLLDPYLANLIQSLVDAYLWYCTKHAQEFLKKHNLGDNVTKLPEAVACIFYAFCKVRGRKIIVRLLNNEPRYVEPLLSCFRLWTFNAKTQSDEPLNNVSWEIRYAHILWLSHLMFAPFELSTISGLSVGLDEGGHFSDLCAGLPDVSVSLVLIGLKHLHLPSKAREAASILLVRVALRRDMQELGLIKKLVQWSVTELSQDNIRSQTAGYFKIGILELLFGIVNSASDSEASPYLDSIFQVVYKAATSSEKHFQALREFAPARKLLVKIMRSTVAHAIANENVGSRQAADLDLNTMLEDCIQTVLDFLADKDTPVRQAASKAISLICLKLETRMSVEVVEAVVDSLNENMLLEDIHDGKLFPITDITKDSSRMFKKNLNAVDPLKWHGCMLTLGHLLFRRSLPPPELSAVIEALLMGLNFEQRSNVGTSVGVGVRDAACFGIWSLARKYSTVELNQAFVSTTLLPNPTSYSGGLAVSTIQLIATHLAMSACLDPSGNLRRGASAALQELIGRHPDVIVQGIPVVQAIDYHAVARHSRAVLEVAIATSNLSDHYHGALLYALLGWRGARTTDVDSRRQAAEAIGMLVLTVSLSDHAAFVTSLISQISDLKASNTGTNAAARHGLLCSLAAIVESAVEDNRDQTSVQVLAIAKPPLQDMSIIVGMITGRISADIENVLESVSKVILATARLLLRIKGQDKDAIICPSWAKWAVSALPMLERCTTSSDKIHASNVAAQANLVVLKLLDDEAQSTLISSWMDKQRQGKANSTSKGLTATLGSSFQLVYKTPHLMKFSSSIVLYMLNIVNSSHPIELKVNAMQGVDIILSTVLDMEGGHLGILADVVNTGLRDYTADNRGDIGSLLRLESIASAGRLLEHNITESRAEQTVQALVQLAAEKLTKVRFQAWVCLEGYFRAQGQIFRTFEHQADVSSYGYFRTLVVLLEQPQYRPYLLQGLTTSIASGTEEISRACCQALIAYFQDQSATGQQTLIISVIEELSQQALVTVATDDREVIPVIDSLAFFVEHLLVTQHTACIDRGSEIIWELCSQIQTNTSTLLRLESLIRLYSSMSMLETQRVSALERLTRLLLHRWPKIRGATADAIALSTTNETLINCDWSAPVLDNKLVVLALRKDLGVAGSRPTKIPSVPIVVV